MYEYSTKPSTYYSIQQRSNTECLKVVSGNNTHQQH